MKNPSNIPEGAAKILWERPEPKGPLTPISRDVITRAATAIADRDGLESVSLRKVAISLDSSTMRLYSYISTKAELLELMTDAAFGEMLTAGPPQGDWQEILRSLAYRLREAAGKHPWLVELLGGRPHLGPNGIAFIEIFYASLSGARGFEKIDTIMQTVGTVVAYVVGALRNETNRLQTLQEFGMDQTAWEQAWWPYLERLLASGRFPMMERVVKEANHPSAGAEFERGLDCVLAGISLVLLQGQQ
ncbi:TetR/AcrR family transcriptional regulator [Rhizobium arsenicireducens]|jgi:AcrR family transcriptional regulator